MSSVDWQLPVLTEQERLAMEAKKKERELLSNAMGQYLLKGYRMLGSNCTLCGNILLKAPRDDVDFCIYCQEINKEQSPPGQESSGLPSIPHTQTKATSTTAEKMDSTPPTTARDLDLPSNQAQIFSQTKEALVSKLQWATAELSGTMSVEYSTQLCILIRETIDAFRKIKECTNSEV